MTPKKRKWVQGLSPCPPEALLVLQIGEIVECLDRLGMSGFGG
jgi:hypothetical protein